MAAQTPVNRTGAQMLTISCVEGEVILGVDTHRDTHAAVLIDPLGRLLATETFATTRRGHRAMIAWAQLRGTVRRAGVEGTGSFGAGLTRTLRLEGIEVIEVTRATRVGGRHRGKNDTRDAEAAARSVLSGQATAEPKARDGIVESIRVLRNTRASAVKARTQAILHLKNLIVTAPDELREALGELTTASSSPAAHGYIAAGDATASARHVTRCAASPAATRPSTPRSPSSTRSSPS